MANDTEKRITAKMVLDSTGFNQGLQGINQQLKLAQSKFKATDEQVKAFGNNTDRLKNATDGLSKQIELQRQKVDVYKDSIEKSTQKLQDTIKARDELKRALDEEKNKYDEVVKLYGKESEEAKKAQESIDNLTQEYKKKEKQVESTSKTINNYSVNMNKAEAELAKMQGELKKTNTELDRSNNKWIQASTVLKDSSEKLKNTGETISRAGDGLLKISAPLLAAGTASAKLAMDFENSMAKVSTISDDTQIPLEKLSKAIIDLSDETGIAATDIANNVYDAISAGQSTGDAVNFVTNSTKLAKAGFAEAGQSLDLLTTILNAYKMKSSEVVNVSDLLIQVQNKGKVTVGELSSEMGKIIPTAAATNVNLKQLGAGYAILTSNGVKAAESTTYMNSMLTELGKTGTDADKALREMTGKSFSVLMASGKSLGDILNILNGYANKNKLSLTDMFGSAEAGRAALVLATANGKDFNNMLKDMTNTVGATDQAFQKVNNTAGERLNKSLNELKNNAIKLGESLLPVVDKVSGVIGNLADKIGQMDEKQLSTITNLAFFTAGLGGILKIGGGVVSTVGNIAGAVGKLSGLFGATTVAAEGAGAAAGAAAGAGGLGALSTSLGGVVVAAAPYLLAAAAVAGTGYAIYKGMTEEAVPAVDLFADKIEYAAQTVNDASGDMSVQVQSSATKISDSTKKSVGAYMDFDKQASDALLDLRIKSGAISKETADTLVSTFISMGEQIKAGIQKNFDEEYKIMQEFYTNSKALTDKEEADSLKSLQDNYNFQKDIVDGGTKEIKAIMDKASAEKRALTEEESRIIANIQDNMKTQAVKTLSENEVEAQVILQRMKDYDGRITAEQVAEHIKQLNDSRDKAVAIANDEYNKRIAAIVKMRDESKVISADQANSLITEAGRQRDGIVQSAEDTRYDAIQKMRGLYSDLDSQVNTGTGEIITNWDKLKRWWSGWKPESKVFNWSLNQLSANKSQSSSGIPGNASGTDYWQGGLTTLHEQQYEVYDLPRGTRIYNHDASEDLVKKTAEAVASKLLNNTQSNNSLVVQIDKFMNNRAQDVQAFAQELEFYRRQASLAKGGAY